MFCFLGNPGFCRAEGGTPDDVARLADPDFKEREAAFARIANGLESAAKEKDPGRLRALLRPLAEAQGLASADPEIKQRLGALLQPYRPGARLWGCSFPAHAPGFGLEKPFVLPQGILLTSGLWGDGGMALLDRGSGEILWLLAKKLLGRSSVPLLVEDNLLVCGVTEMTRQGWMRLIDLATGKTSWESPPDALPGPVWTAFVKDEGVYLAGPTASRKGWIALFDPEARALRWKKDVFGHPILSMRPAAGGLLLTGDNGAEERPGMALFKPGERDLAWTIDPGAFSGEVRFLSADRDTLLLAGAAQQEDEEEDLRILTGGDEPSWAASFDLASGKRLWERKPADLPGTVWRADLPEGEGVAILKGKASGDLDWMQACDARSGRILWSLASGDDLVRLALPGTPQGIPVWASDGTLSLLDLRTGRPRWKATGKGIDACPWGTALKPEGLLVWGLQPDAPPENFRIRLLSTESGETLWTAETDFPALPAVRILDLPGRFLVLSERGEYAILDRSTGCLRAGGVLEREGEAGIYHLLSTGELLSCGNGWAALYRLEDLTE